MSANAKTQSNNIQVMTFSEVDTGFINPRILYLPRPAGAEVNTLFLG